MHTNSRPQRLKELLASTIVLLTGLSFVATATATVKRKPSRPAPEGWQLAGDAVNGKLIYKQYCQKCHGKRGNGQGTMAKDLEIKPRDFTDEEVMRERSDWEIYLGIKEGGAPVGLSEQMTAWEDTLTEDEMLDVATFVRQFVKTKAIGDDQ